MRVFCDSCRHPQPPGWKAGDFCVNCGQVARRETRCYWCLHSTPAGKFCRHCGAGLVEDGLFGAARMLKDAGVDRFSVPARLRELDPEQVDTFNSIYDQHAGVMWRHLEDLLAVQRRLVQKHWVAELEEQLLPQLPWPEQKLESLRLPPLPLDEPIPILRFIRETTPISQTKLLARLALANLGDTDSCSNVYREAYGINVPVIREEVNQTLTHWRCFYESNAEYYYAPILPQGAHRQIVADLEASPLKKEAAVRLGMVREMPVPTEWMDDADPDIAFMAALANGDVDRLTAAAQSNDELKRFAAAWRLIAMGAAGAVAGEALLAATRDHRERLLKHASQTKRSSPGLRPALFTVLKTESDSWLRESAGSALSRGCPPEDALEVARLTPAGGGLQSLLQTANLPPETLEEVGFYLVKAGRFSHSHFGMSTIAKQGRMPASFVPRAFPSAETAMRLELIQFAGVQLQEYADEALYRFLMSLAFGASGHEVMVEAWCTLSRFHGPQYNYEPKKVEFSVAFGERSFGSFPAFLRAIIQLLEFPNTASESLIRGHISSLLRYPQEGAGLEIAKCEAEARLLEERVMKVASNSTVDLDVKIACIWFLAEMSRHEACRKRVVKFLQKPATKSELGANCGYVLEYVQRFE